MNSLYTRYKTGLLSNLARDSPIELHVTPGLANGARSVLHPAPMPMLNHVPAVFQVQACDRWGNKLDHGGSTYLAIDQCQAATLSGDTDNKQISHTCALSEAYINWAFSCGTVAYVNEGHVTVDLGADYVFDTGMSLTCSAWVGYSQMNICEVTCTALAHAQHIHMQIVKVT